ncbi:MAG: transcription-repair coupling factor, partial [Porticoccaceae bacterium]|nr:transcription-repair coupling factor [Porticoccaceae bacterium]
ADCQSESDLHELQVEMIDRFGLLPEVSKTLFKLAELRLVGEQLGLKKIEAGLTRGRLQFKSTTIVEPITIIKMVQSKPSTYRLQNNDQLSFTMDMENPEQRFSIVHNILQGLLPPT